jgi:heat-inducible transcriptional repressor
MSVQPNLTDRYQTILKATIKHYIATAEPVGSKTLVEEYNFSVSSATIRNALGQLEKAGLLYQPHTSAGRIPSDWGYRIYVDRLLTPDVNIKQRLDQHLTRKLKGENWSFEALLQRSAQILANLSGYIALITFPQTSITQLRHLQLVQISDRQIMLVVVMDSYQTQSILMDLPVSIQQQEEDSDTQLEEELQIISNFLNSKLRNLTLRELNHLDWLEVDKDFSCYADFLKSLLKQIGSCLQPASLPQIIIHGISEVIRLPEFSQLEQVQMLLHLLEAEQAQLLPLIFELPESETLPKRVTVRIGSENPLESMRPCSLISAIYHQGNVPAGSVGIIGPTRMLYENTIPLVESAADYLSEALS